jgi:pimeloyl-ACP methyl ester carboxylesterase
MLGDRFDDSSGERRERWMTSGRAFVVEERSARLAAPPYELADIQAPVVYGRSGDLDALVPIAEFLKANLRQVEEIVLPGADHHAHRTDVERFTGLVRRAIELRRR